MSARPVVKTSTMTPQMQEFAIVVAQVSSYACFIICACFLFQKKNSDCFFVIQ